MSEPVARPAVAVIDGNVTRAAESVKILSQFFRSGAFRDGKVALDTLARQPCAVVVMDEMAPPTGAPALLHQMRGDPKLAGIGVVLISADGPAAKATALAAGADLVLPRPLDRNALVQAVTTLTNRNVEAKWEQLPTASRDVLRKTVDAFNGFSDEIIHGEHPNLGTVRDACSHLVTAVQNNDYRAILDGVRDHDNYSYVHSLRVATFLSVFGHAIGLKGDDLLTVATGGLVHDIGKMTIPLDVLNKPGQLDPKEWIMMQSHVTRTVSVLHRVSHIPKGVIVIAEQHHEKLNGTGYPKKLKGAQLNELARMASIVDVFGALTDRRVYKAPMSPEDALDLMLHEMGSSLDQKLLVCFQAMLLDASRNME
jgi:putative nucleotidyltransferase with HDIG domain